MADKAILFGINEYQSIAPLRGCERDIENIERLLVSKFNFDSDNIRSFRNEEVTKDVVEENFEWLAEDAAPNDRLVFHFSGHGSYTSSVSNDKEIDELICLYDMDFNNPDTFIRDTDLGKLTRKVTSGARLTVILDSCHSGDGTRGLTKDLRAARTVSPRTSLMIVRDTARQLAKVEGTARDHEKRLFATEARSLRQLRDEATPPVFARFVEPPSALRIEAAERQAMRVRKLGEEMRIELNHQLLAAAHETQTAADAFIDGAYQGAFSFYFCQEASRTGMSSSYETIMHSVSQAIETAGFSQTPQIDGPFSNERLFGGSLLSVPDQLSLPEEPSPDMPARIDEAGAGSADFASSPLETLNHLLRVSEKLVDLAGAQVRAPVTGLVRTAQDEVVVYVHGISRHMKDYSVPWFAAMSPHLSHSIPRSEVLWSQHVNPRVAERNLAKDLERERLQRKIEAELQARSEQLECQANRHLANNTTRSVVHLEQPRGSGFSLDDFTRYMVVESTREAILGEFLNVVIPLLSAGKKLHIISHSWGTVVAYEGMRRLDARSFAGRVAHLFTVGAALAIDAVQKNLFGRVTDGRRPSHVQRIINVNAGGDLVGGPIGDAFAVDREHLGLEPTGCRTIPFTDIAFSTFCAHSSYFLPANLEVNRQILANNINRT